MKNIDQRVKNIENIIGGICFFEVSPTIHYCSNCQSGKVLEKMIQQREREFAKVEYREGPIICLPLKIGECKNCGH
jgi:hypothetical protein